MKIILIKPSGMRAAWQTRFYFLSLSLPIIAAHTQEEYDVTIFDEANGMLPEELPFADVVGISVLTSTAPRAYLLADSFRSRGIKVILGGIHVSFCPDEALRHADAIVIGEGESVWKTILNDVTSDSLKRVYNASIYEDFTLSPPPNWGALSGVNNRQMLYTVQTRRGCPYGCEFCTVPAVFGKKVRTRNIEMVIEEIESIPSNKFFIIDDNFFAQKEYSLSLCEHIASLGKEWMAEGNLAHLNDDKLLALIRRAGCRDLFIGLESINIANEKVVSHKASMHKYEETIARINDHGIRILGSFIVGFDNDKIDVFDQTYEFIERTKIFFPILNVLTPYPGTILYKNMEKENRIIERDWAKYTSENVVFIPRQMSPEELTDGFNSLRKQIASRFVQEERMRQKRSSTQYTF